MESDLYKKAEQFMIEQFTKTKDESNISHHQTTVEWIKKLKPNANESLLIAGILHDIERAIFGDWKAGSQDPAKIKKHEKQSAEIAEKFLINQNADKKLINLVKNLILFHEQGGNFDQNVLCDADGLAFLQEKAIKKAKQYKEQGKTEEIKKLLSNINNKIKSAEAKIFAKPFYDELVAFSKDI